MTLVVRDIHDDTGTTTDKFKFTITHNEDPVVANPIPNPAISIAGYPFSITVPPNTFSEPEGEALWYEYEITPNAPWLSFNNNTMTFGGTVTDNAYAQKYTLKISAHDPWDDTDFAIDELEFTITENFPVVIKDYQDQYSRVPNATSWSFGADFVTDPDGLPITTTITLNGSTSLPPWLSYDESTHSFSVQSPTLNEWQGEHLIRMEFDDIVHVTPVEFTYTLDPNFPPNTTVE